MAASIREYHLNRRLLVIGVGLEMLGQLSFFPLSDLFLRVLEFAKGDILD
jgi:hypothetical protein